MILTPIARDELVPALDRFEAGLRDPTTRHIFRQIRTTAPHRASDARAESHRLRALALARQFGVPVHPPGTRCRFNWDGTALDGATEAYVILHEVAHFVLAPPERRALVDFGLGPGPDTRDRDAAERAAVLPLAAREEDEAAASLLGILWEAALGQPALASFLDQNWLEGLDRRAADHFTRVLAGLRRQGLLDQPPLSAAGRWRDGPA
ncbi:MAG: elongation factor P hydroxylase [Stellaceae bacterium]